MSDIGGIAEQIETHRREAIPHPRLRQSINEDLAALEARLTAKINAAQTPTIQQVTVIQQVDGDDPPDPITPATIPPWIMAFAAAHG